MRAIEPGHLAVAGDAPFRKTERHAEARAVPARQKPRHEDDEDAEGEQEGGSEAHRDSLPAQGVAPSGKSEMPQSTGVAIPQLPSTRRAEYMMRTRPVTRSLHA